jgi:peptidoglycan/LPS O-acetylase OafA/YrhL
MFWGALFRRWHDQPMSNGINSFSRSVKTILIWFPIVLCSSPLVVMLAQNVVPSAYLSKIFRLFIPIAIGLGLFILFSTKLKINNRLCTWFGEISYSLYLFHPLVFYSLFILVRDGHLPALNGAHLSFYLMLSVLGSVVLSAATYYLIEKPAIRLGRKLAGR